MAWPASVLASSSVACLPSLYFNYACHLTLLVSPHSEICGGSLTAGAPAEQTASAIPTVARCIPVQHPQYTTLTNTSKGHAFVEYSTHELTRQAQPSTREPHDA